MRTLHVGLKVSDRQRSLAFYRALGYDVVGSVAGTGLGELTMLKLPGDEFVTVELVSDPPDGQVTVGLNHLVVQVESMATTVSGLDAQEIDVEELSAPEDPEDPLTGWVTDPDGHRIELVQWPTGHPDGLTSADWSDQHARSERRER